MKDINLGCSFKPFGVVVSKCACIYKVSSKKEDAASQLCSVIFAPDPVTNLPKSDIAIYLDPNVDPAVRDFIKVNLMQEIPSTEGVPDEFSDMLVDLIRGEDESVAAYAQRVDSMLAEDSDFRSKLAIVKDSKLEE